ncbi:Proprotein convertase subtilisin/kexin type 5 precursor [Giardia lamblia P15]|uniref:Proprotein convertase subtilisin/kexin type 5 n=1 Tax=Giardia intestinalis (strain P15) TaxID=658858 RepID=E1F6M0_GIAIA|nr:Proprotein convertase subtilisin/kexin type 5 precursor [Giardia lamblia P15]
MLALLFFGMLSNSLAAYIDGKPTPNKNTYYVACEEDQPDCVENKCVIFAHERPLCTECKSGKVPIDGECVDASSTSGAAVCEQESVNGGGTRCKSCTGGKGSSNTDNGIGHFLFYGGCYNNDEWPGTDICKTVSNGVCTVCDDEYGAVFTNPNTTANERCILCSDTLSGMEGCATCVSLPQNPTPETAGSAVNLQCTSCLDETKAPIDGVCADFGSNKCKNGYCTHCTVGYIHHRGGCYSNSKEGTKICAEANQIEIGGCSACKQCTNTSEAPHNGKCRQLSILNSCQKDSSAGMCTACNQRFYGRPVFLYKGGCYVTTDLLGGTICKKTFNGKCTICNEDQGYFMKDSTCTRCDEFVPGCAMCTSGSDASSAPVCTSCKAGKYATLDGTSCVDSCPPGTSGSCDENNICSCKCSTGTYLDVATNTCSTCNSACTACTGPGTDKCTSCALGKYLKRDTSGATECVDSADCGEGYYADDVTRSCSSCDIDKCQTCAPDGGVLKCVKCSSGYLSIDSRSCLSQCDEPNQQADASGKPVCECIAGAYLEGSGCVQCNSACLECKGPGSDNCTKCSSDKYTKVDGSGTIACVDASGCGDRYYADPEKLQCAKCGIESCQVCTREGNNIKCTKCSSGFVSIDGSSCTLACKELTQKEEDGKCVCAEGFELSSDGTCVAKNICPSDVIGCSSCSTSGECLSCVDSSHSIQLNKRSCAPTCPSGSQSVDSFCTCMDGYTLKDDVCISQTRKTNSSSSSTITAVAITISIFIIVVVVLTCWLVLRKRRGSRAALEKKMAAENMKLMGSVDEF